MQHASDCAVHNAPALDPGACTCGTAHGPRVTRFDATAQMLVDMLIPGSRLDLKSVRALERPGFGHVIAFEVEHECVDIPAGYVSVSFRQVTAIGGARVSIFNAADPAPEPVYPRAPYETPKLEATYKARELLELFKACTPEERACVLDYLDADPRPAAPPVSPVQIVEPLTEEQQALVKGLVEDGIAYARRFFGDLAATDGGAVGEGSLFSHPAGAGLMGEAGPEAIVPSGRRYTFTHDATQAARLDRLKDWPDGPCGSCGGRDEVHAKDCAIFEWSVGDAPEPGRVEIVKAATEACAHRFVRTGFDPDGPLVVCADCGAPIKRMGVVVTGTAGDPIDAAAVSRAIAKSG